MINWIAYFCICSFVAIVKCGATHYTRQGIKEELLREGNPIMKDAVHSNFWLVIYMVMFMVGFYVFFFHLKNQGLNLFFPILLMIGLYIDYIHDFELYHTTKHYIKKGWLKIPNAV